MEDIMSKSKLKWIGLQFFADGEGGEGEGNPGGEGNQGGENPGGNNPAPKTFTQEEVNRMLANEKRQGRQSVLKDLGIDVNDKDGVKKAKESLDSLKTQAQKDSEALEAAKTAQTEALTRATLAEQKLAVLEAGCKSEYVSEVTALASAKVDDKTTFEDAIKSVKEKMAMFFQEDDPGTGGGQGHKRSPKDEKAGSMGKRLAESMTSKPTENPYFKN
jgi:hypothetical protein